jgi:hypothetical protein
MKPKQRNSTIKHNTVHYWFALLLNQPLANTLLFGLLVT